MGQNQIGRQSYQVSKTGIIKYIIINNIVDEVESEIRLYADDCVCYRPVANVQDCEESKRISIT